MKPFKNRRERRIRCAIIGALVFHNYEPTEASQIAETAGLSHGSIHSHLARLERTGYIKYIGGKYQMT